MNTTQFPGQYMVAFPSTPIRVLLVEDSEVDCELMPITLARGPQATPDISSTPGQGTTLLSLPRHRGMPSGSAA